MAPRRRSWLCLVGDTRGWAWEKDTHDRPSLLLWNLGFSRESIQGNASQRRILVGMSYPDSGRVCPLRVFQPLSLIHGRKGWWNRQTFPPDPIIVQSSSDALQQSSNQFGKKEGGEEQEKVLIRKLEISSFEIFFTLVPYILPPSSRIFST